MNDLLSFFLCLLLLPYFLVPILIRRSQLFPLKPNMRKLLPAFLPKAVDEYFKETSDHLATFGFDYRIDTISLDYGPNLRVFMRMLVAEAKGVVAIVTSLLSDGERIPLRNFIEFSSHFTNGHEISTHNSDLSGAPIEPTNRKSRTFPLVTDAKILFALHEYLVKKTVSSSSIPLLPHQGSEFEFLVNNFKRDLANQAKLGCLMLDKKHDCYRPTWAGAFLMGWYSMWPLSFIRRSLQKIRARIELKALKKASA